MMLTGMSMVSMTDNKKVDESTNESTIVTKHTKKGPLFSTHYLRSMSSFTGKHH